MKSYILVLLVLLLVVIFVIGYYFYSNVPKRKEESLKLESVEVSNKNPKVYDTVDINIKISGRIEDPFNEDEINVTSEITLPDKRVVAFPAFYHQDYNRSLVNGKEVLTPIGDPYWKVRFTPFLEGNYLVKINLYKNKKLENYSFVNFFVKGYSHDLGFVRMSKTGYLYLENGSGLFLIGENLCWYSSNGTYDYDNWFSKMKDNGENYARIWLAPWAFGIGWSRKVGHYNLEEAWKLDYVMNLAKRNGIYVMLCLVNHGQLIAQDNWNDNPYNSKNGGPISYPYQFFTNTEAKEYFKKFLRYMVARYSGYTNLLAWELFNEVDLTDNYNPTSVANWHTEMASYIRSIDPYKHLVTTSFSSLSAGDLIWRQSNLDFTQLHIYGPKDLSEAICNQVSFMKSSYNLPVLVGEFASDWRWFNSPYYYKDKEGVEIHEGIWSSTMCGSFGTAMLWWWDNYIDPFNLYYHYKALKEFLDGISFYNSNFSILSYDVINKNLSKASYNFKIYGLQNATFAMGWVKSNMYNWFNVINNVTLEEVGDIKVRLSNLKDGNYTLELWNTYEGKVTSVSKVKVVGGEVIIDIPKFKKDFAFKLIFDNQAQ
ncbi:MAG: cellulase family glycosylhydrolase [Thermoproteota archaeon]|nr:cellulase family glycosylhydrolase [Candidatus Brockarchaeota archaeon]